MAKDWTGSKHKIIFIVPYFGKFPSYFDIWLLSVSYNPDIDFLLITDIDYKKKYPNNVRLLKWSFEDLKRYIQKNFDFKINIKTPYNLCDFKPAYGLIFREYIQGYDFWGNCDIDQVFGDVRSFIREDILGNYEMIQYLGHFLLYKNNSKINSLFMQSGGLYDYKTVYSTDEWYSFGEVTGLLQKVILNNIKYYNRPCYADLRIAHRQCRLSRQHKNYDNQVFYWDEGKIYQAYIENGQVLMKEFMYLHFQKRNPVNKLHKLDKIKSFYCFTENFLAKKKGIPTIEDIYKYSCYRGYLYMRYEKFMYIIKKLNQFLLCSTAQKKIWIMQKISKNKLLKAEITEK